MFPLELHSSDYSVNRGMMDYIVRFPDGNTLQIAPVQHLIVQRAGHRIPLPAYEATNQEIIAAAIMIRNDSDEIDLFATNLFAAELEEIGSKEIDSEEIDSEEIGTD